MATNSTDDPAMTDHLWTGYHPLAMAPVIGLCFALSLTLWTGRWYMDRMSDLSETLGNGAMFVLAWGVWPAVTTVFLYRTVTFTYRLTNRSVLADFGPIFLPIVPIPLTEVDDVVVGCGRLRRLLGVGYVEIRAGTRRLRLKGVRRPHEFAERVRTQAKAARTAATRSVTASRH